MGLPTFPPRGAGPPTDQGAAQDPDCPGAGCSRGVPACRSPRRAWVALATSVQAAVPAQNERAPKPVLFVPEPNCTGAARRCGCHAMKPAAVSAEAVGRRPRCPVPARISVLAKFASVAYEYSTARAWGRCPRANSDEPTVGPDAVASGGVTAEFRVQESQRGWRRSPVSRALGFGIGHRYATRRQDAQRARPWHIGRADHRADTRTPSHAAAVLRGRRRARDVPVGVPVGPVRGAARGAG
jgi:hypothetical protein